MASNFPLRVARNIDAGQTYTLPVAAGQTFVEGALLLMSSNELIEASADPTALLCIAQEPASVGLATGGSIHGGTKIRVYVPGPGSIFFISSTTTPVFATHHGVLYGVVKSTNWLLDISETTAVPFKVVGISLSPEPEGFFVTPNMGYWVTSGIIS